MGVDYYICSRCNETFSDHDDHEWCLCGERFCGDCMEYLDQKIPNEKDEREECFYCTSDKNIREVTNGQFLKWLVDITGKTKQDYLNYLK